jgi:subtilisin
MAKYVLVNRRSGLFDDDKKIASRASVQTTLRLLGTAHVVADHNPSDPLARQVALIEANPADIATLRNQLPDDAILEPAVRRGLHRQRVPIELKDTIPLVTAKAAVSALYQVKITGGGASLADIDVIVYLRDSAGRVQDKTVRTDKNGLIRFPLPSGSSVAFVEPIPYAGFWIMLSDAPRSGATIDCPAIPPASTRGGGWWHGALNVDLNNPSRGAGIKVGVIDTGCGPHPNLKHVTLVGAFVDGGVLPASQARDVGEHGTHTTGIIGARPTAPRDYAGIAVGCELFHARVFKGEGPDDGPTQADIINAVDSLSRDYHCDLINMSLGGDGPKSKAEEDAIRDASERGTLCVCSAGNDAGSIDFPGAYSECAAVSAIGKVGQAPAGTFSANNRPHDASRMGRDNFFLASFSSFGPTLACAAPGVGIVSTVPDRPGFTDAYMEMDGTSMASPAACGVLAIILSQDPVYRSLPRDITRTRRAALLLAQHCQTLGLPVEFEGRGIPVV